MTNLPAVAIDFETTCATADAQATELGLCPVIFSDKGILNPRMDAVAVRCKPDRDISFGAMAVTGICPEDVANEDGHKTVVPALMPPGEAYIIGHNVDYDIQVAANAGVDVSQYKRICTQALARRLMPDADSHSLGALMYAINMNHARNHCRNAHNAGYDVTFTLWLLEHLCELGGLTNMQDLHNASEEARIPLTFTFGKYYGQKIADVDKFDRGYLQYVIRKMTDRPYLVQACEQALAVKQVGQHTDLFIDVLNNSKKH